MSWWCLSRTEELEYSETSISPKPKTNNHLNTPNSQNKLANFTFHPSPYTTIEVSLFSNPENPFISISLNPISTSYIPLNLDFAMPPIPQSENWVEDGQMGSVDGGWRISRVSVSRRLAFVRVDGSRLGFGMVGDRVGGCLRR